jgi:hypothetical protein
VPAPQQTGRVRDLLGLQAGVLELMTLEVGRARGTLDAAQAEARIQVISAELAQLNQRLRVPAD